MEKDACLTCASSLPQMHIQNLRDNEVFDVFKGRVWIEKAYAHFMFEKHGSVQQLIHSIKYHNYQDLGKRYGADMGLKLKEKLGDIDAIVPVPIHKQRLHKRGYNQSLCIAEGIGETIEKPLLKKAMKRNKNEQSLTFKSRAQRWKKMNKAFEVSKPHLIEGKHILLVDDVITTGATLESMAANILEIPNTKVSVISLAYTQLN